jgi:hypothetical protein
MRCVCAPRQYSGRDTDHRIARRQLPPDGTPVSRGDRDCHRLARVAKLAGAPKASAAGVEFLAPLGTVVEQGQPLFVLHAEAHGELHYALDYVNSQPDVVTLGETQ